MKLTMKEKIALNEAKDKLVLADRCHLGCFRAYASESEEHIRKKFELWLEARRQGTPVYTEARLVGGGRGDLFFPLDDRIVEVGVSEVELKKDKLYGVSKVEFIR